VREGRTSCLFFSRIDQVWVGAQTRSGFEVVRQWVERTVYSDHRMVICEVKVGG
jgi:hypothetical protein